MWDNIFINCQELKFASLQGLPGNKNLCFMWLLRCICPAVELRCNKSVHPSNICKRMVDGGWGAIWEFICCWIYILEFPDPNPYFYVHYLLTFILTWFWFCLSWQVGRIFTSSLVYTPSKDFNYFWWELFPRFCRNRTFWRFPHIPQSIFQLYLRTAVNYAKSWSARFPSTVGRILNVCR